MDSGRSEQHHKHPDSDTEIGDQRIHVTRALPTIHDQSRLTFAAEVSPTSPGFPGEVPTRYVGGKM